MLQQELEYLRTVVETLQRGAYAYHIARLLLHGIGELAVQLMQVAHQHGVASKVTEIAPDIGLTEETVRFAPHLGLLAEIVEEHHLPLRHSGEIGMQPFGSPLVAFVIKHPAHLEPLCLWVHLLQRGVDVARHACQIVRLPTGRVHLVERVNSIDMVGAIEGSLFLKVFALYDGEKAVGGVHEIGGFETAPAAQPLDVGLGVALGNLAWHMSGKGWQHGCHIQLALACQYLLLQFLLPIYPALR